MISCMFRILPSGQHVCAHVFCLFARVMPRSIHAPAHLNVFCHHTALHSLDVLLLPSSGMCFGAACSAVREGPSNFAKVLDDLERELGLIVMRTRWERHIHPPVESVAGTVDPVVETTDEPEVVASFPGNITLRMALVTLDDQCAVFRQRAAVMKSVLHVLRGHSRNALKPALEEATWRNCRDDEVRHERRWKLIMLLPRMLLHRPPCGGSIPRTKLVASLEAFSGEWIQLFTAGAACDEKAAIGRIQQSRRKGGDDLERRVLRAERLAHVGELSSDR